MLQSRLYKSLNFEHSFVITMLNVELLLSNCIRLIIHYNSYIYIYIYGGSRINDKNMPKEMSILQTIA